MTVTMESNSGHILILANPSNERLESLKKLGYKVTNTYLKTK